MRGRRAEPPIIPVGTLISLASLDSFPIPSVAARHLPLIRGVGPLTGGIGPRQRGPKRTPPQKKPPSDEGGGICEANDGGRDRAATWGRPYES